MEPRTPPAPDRRAKPRPGLARALRFALAAPIVVLLALVAAQTLPTLTTKDVWFPDELRHAAVLRGLLDQGHWLVLHLGEALYPDKPPLYFWLLAALARLTGTTEPVLFMLAAALSGMALVGAQTALGRALGLSRRVVLLAGLVLLSNWFFIDRMHQPRMDLLFAAFILLAHLGFFRAAGTTGPVRPGWAAFAALMAMAAVLTKGPFGLALPLLALAVHLARQGRLRVLWSRAMAPAWAIMTAIGAAYLGGVLAVGGSGALRALLIEQTLERAIGAARQTRPFWWYLPQIALAFLPWTLLLPAALLHHRPRPHWRLLLRAAPGERAGPAYLAWALVTGLVAISVTGYKVVHLIVPLYGLLALAAAYLLARLPAHQRHRLFVAIGALLLVAAPVAGIAPRLTLWPEHVRGAWLIAAGLALAGLVALALRGRGPLVFAAGLSLSMTLLALPFYHVTIRGLNPVMAPRALAEVLARHAALGHDLVEYHDHYLGHFDYHARVTLTGITDQAVLAARIEAVPCGVLVLPLRDFEGWAAGLAEFEPLLEQRLDYLRYVVVRWGDIGCPRPDAAE